jgi:ribosome-associated protein
MKLSNFEKRGASVVDLTFASDTNVRIGALDIETINPTCIEWWRATSVLSKSVLPKVSEKTAPKPARKTSTRAAALKAQPDADKTLKLILSRLDDMKAEETVTIDLRGKSAFSDYMVITTGRVNRHVGAIAENVAKGLKENGIASPHVEGLPNCDWVLIDSGDVIVHIFRPEVREFYNLERLWTQGPAAKAI